MMILMIILFVFAHLATYNFVVSVHVFAWYSIVFIVLFGFSKQFRFWLILFIFTFWSFFFLISLEVAFYSDLFLLILPFLQDAAFLVHMFYDSFIPFLLLFFFNNFFFIILII